MALLARITSVWSGWPGGPGYTHFYAAEGDEVALQSQTAVFWGFIEDCLPLHVTVHTPASGDIIDDATGDMVGVWAEGAAVDHSGTDAGSFSAPAGACITWHTGLFLSGRELRGRSFIVPMGATSYDGDGTLLAGRQAVLDVAAGNLVTGVGSLAVYSPTHHTSAPIINGIVADRCAVLRSRRN